MTHFLDSSAIVAAYATESKSRRARELLRGAVAVSRLAEVETVSALARLAREHALPVARRDAVIGAFVSDLDHWTIVEISAEVTLRARELLVRRPLRASDAVQLASALLMRDRLPRGLDAFVAFDKRLADAARAEGLSVVEQ